jgi:predicted enzyme related to lactoylglutathione lyase
MPNPVVHFEVLGKDAEALQRFYSQAFDWQVDANNQMNYGMVAAQEGGIGGGVGPAPEGDGHATFYVQVDDAEAALAKVESLGGKRVAGPMDIPEGPTIALFTDPEGHLVGLASGM